MSTTFRPHAPEQSLLLPPDVREWLPEGHLAHHVSDLVDGLDLTAFYAPYEGDGRRNTPYDPRMMVKVLLYGYATGVFSSRRIARKLEEDVGFRLLAAGNFSQHRTLCEFRRRHLADFQALFVEVVRLAQELGLARLGYVALGREGKQTRSRDPEKYPATNRMAEKLSKPEGRATYAERKWLSEAPHGWIKHVLGFRRFSLRGLAKVRGEWVLVCLALNVKRLHVLMAAQYTGMWHPTATDRRASRPLSDPAARPRPVSPSGSLSAENPRRRPTANVALPR